MSFAELYNIIGNTLIILGTSLGVIYAVLSFTYFIYRYIKGEDVPNINSTPDFSLNSVKTYLNPYAYKHPSLMAFVSFGIIGSLYVLAFTWPVIGPLLLMWFLIERARKKNLEKKKMWAVLKS